ncbi:MAG: tetratricopeptide repeat protein [Deltaproteobacteria bacterium]|nr:tetratricopeptide repeat protein [Deltaproteobacteria bacterium]
MRSDRLWPVLVGTGLFLGCVGGLEWLGSHHEARFEVITLANQPEASADGSGGIEGGWETLAAGPEQERARRVAKMGQPEAALEIYRVLTTDPATSAELLAEHAKVARAAKRCDEAMALAERAVAGSPDNGSGWLAKGLAARCLGLQSEVLGLLRKAAELRPNHSRTLLILSDELEDEGKTGEALEALRPVFGRGSSLEQAQVSAAAGQLEMKLRDFKAARAALKDAVQRAPASVEIWEAVAKAFLFSTEPADIAAAAEHAASAVKLGPDVAAVQLTLGKVLERQERQAEALAAYQKALTIDPSYDAARAKVARLALELEQPRLAREAADELVRRDATSADNQFMLGLVAAGTGEIETARKAYAEAIRLRDDFYPAGWFNLGSLERDAKQPVAAVAAYRKAIEQRKDYDEAWNNLGLVQLDMEQVEEAIGSFKQAAAIDATSAAAWGNLGKAHAARNDYAAAATAYEEALTRSPKNRTTRLRLAAAYRKTGRVAEAIAGYEALTKDEPRYASAWYNLGIALAAAQRPGEAQKAYETALTLEPEHRASKKNLGFLFAKTGSLDKAVPLLTAAIDAEPTDAESRVMLAQVLLSQGDRNGCLKQALQALTQDRRLEEAKALAAKCSTNP